MMPTLRAPPRKPRFPEPRPARGPFAERRPAPSAAAETRHAPARSDDASELVQGLRAGLAVFSRRPGDVLRVVHTRAVRHELTDFARFAARERLSFEEVADAELDRFAESQHHEGLCVVTRPRRWANARDVADALGRSKGVAVALDRVRNPYNVGAVLRSAAFFGAQGALFGAQAQHPDLAPTAVRVAEGGVEHLLLARTTDLASTLAKLRESGARVVGADGRATAPAAGFAFGRPLVLVLGHEREGLGERVRAQCDALVAIRGSGQLESLNVAVAAGVLLGEVFRAPSA